MAINADLDGQNQTEPSRASYFHQPLQRYTKSFTFADFGAGASDSLALTAFPTDVIIVARALEVKIAFAGEADLAVLAGDTGDPDGQFTSITLHGLAAGWVDIIPGAESGARYEGDYLGDGADIGFTATELNDVTAGSANYYIYYYTPKLSTDTGNAV